MTTIEATIKRAWQHKGEPDRLHYIAVIDGVDRHLIADRGSDSFERVERFLADQHRRTR